QDQELAMPEAVGDFVRRLFSRKLPEEFLDVLNLERAGIQGVLLDEVFHSLSVLAAGPVNYTASAAGRGTSLAVEAGEGSSHDKNDNCGVRARGAVRCLRPGASRAGDARNRTDHAAGEGRRDCAAAGHLPDSGYGRARHAAAWTG